MQIVNEMQTLPHVYGSQCGDTPLPHALSADHVVTLADLTGSFCTSKAASNIQWQDSCSDKLFLSKYLPFF